MADCTCPPRFPPPRLSDEGVTLHCHCGKRWKHDDEGWHRLPDEVPRYEEDR